MLPNYDKAVHLIHRLTKAVRGGRRHEDVDIDFVDVVHLLGGEVNPKRVYGSCSSIGSIEVTLSSQGITAQF